MVSSSKSQIRMSCFPCMDFSATAKEASTQVVSQEAMEGAPALAAPAPDQIFQAPALSLHLVPRS